jgi:hypothetical protein
MSFCTYLCFCSNIYFQFLVFVLKFSTHFQIRFVFVFAGFQPQTKLAEKIMCRPVWEIEQHKTGDT